MKKHLVWATIFILGITLLMGAGCTKKTVGTPEGGDSGMGSGQPLSTTDMMTDEERERQRQIEQAEAEAAAAEAERQRLAQEAALNEQIAREQEEKMKNAFVNHDIYFDYDRWDLSDDAKAALNEKASYMLSHPELRVIVEGHCDERGSNSYNMALGEKRARAAAAYLEVMGISPERMESVSYGEERPKVMGHTEEAYASNRRASFVIK